MTGLYYNRYNYPINDKGNEIQVFFSNYSRAFHYSVHLCVEQPQKKATMKGDDFFLITNPQKIGA